MKYIKEFVEYTLDRVALVNKTVEKMKENGRFIVFENGGEINIFYEDRGGVKSIGDNEIIGLNFNNGKDELFNYLNNYLK